VLTSALRHALFLFARGLCAPCLWLCACCWLVAKNHSKQLQYARAHVFRMLPICVCVCECVVVYVCMLWVLCNTVCWCRTPGIGQACLLPQSALFANINPAPLEGHAHASKSSQVAHLSSPGEHRVFSIRRGNPVPGTAFPPETRPKNPIFCVHWQTQPRVLPWSAEKKKDPQYRT